MAVGAVYFIKKYIAYFFPLVRRLSHSSGQVKKLGKSL